MSIDRKRNRDLQKPGGGEVQVEPYAVGVVGTGVGLTVRKQEQSLRARVDELGTAIAGMRSDQFWTVVLFTGLIVAAALVVRFA